MTASAATEHHETTPTVSPPSTSPMSPTLTVSPSVPSQPSQEPEQAGASPAEQAEQGQEVQARPRRPGRPRKSKAGHYRGDLPKRALRGSYEERVSCLTQDETDLLLTLYSVTVSTRLLLCKTIDPIVYALEWLPEQLAPGLTEQEVERRKRAAYRRVNHLVLHCRSLGFCEVNSQRRRAGDAKDRVLRQLGTENPGGNLGPRADLLSLSREGLRYCKEYLDLPVDGPPGWPTFQSAFARPAHRLVAAELFVALLTLVELGQLEVGEFSVEHEWAPAVIAREGPPERGVKRDPIPRSDVYLRLSPPDRPDLRLEVCVEADRASEKVGVPPPGANPSLYLEAKLHQYAKLAARLGREELNVVWVVPEHAFKPPASRAKSIDRVIDRVRGQRGGGASRVRHMVLPEPTPENVALALSAYLAELARKTPEPGEAESSGDRQTATSDAAAVPSGAGTT